LRSRLASSCWVRPAFLRALIINSHPFANVTVSRPETLHGYNLTRVMNIVGTRALLAAIRA
jgi:hypothetical protein